MPKVTCLDDYGIPINIGDIITPTYYTLQDFGTIYGKSYHTYIISNIYHWEFNPHPNPIIQDNLLKSKLCGLEFQGGEGKCFRVGDNYFGFRRVGTIKNKNENINTGEKMINLSGGKYFNEEKLKEYSQEEIVKAAEEAQKEVSNDNIKELKEVYKTLVSEHIRLSKDLKLRMDELQKITDTINVFHKNINNMYKPVRKSVKTNK